MSAHRRLTDPDDDSHHHEREAERDRVVRWGNGIEKYLRLVWPFILAFATWFGATVWRPIQQVPELARDMKTVVGQIKVLNTNDSISLQDRRLLHDGQNVANRILCFNLARDDRAKYNIDCSIIPLPQK